MVCDVRGVNSSEQVLEVVGVYFGCVQNLFERARFDHVMAWNNDEMFVVGHRDMFAFAKDVEAGTFQGSTTRS